MRWKLSGGRGVWGKGDNCSSIEASGSPLDAEFLEGKTSLAEAAKARITMKLVSLRNTIEYYGLSSSSMFEGTLASAISASLSSPRSSSCSATKESISKTPLLPPISEIYRYSERSVFWGPLLAVVTITVRIFISSLDYTD